MRKLIRIGLVALVAGVAAPSSAHASIIGLLGGEVDPLVPITDIGLFDLTAEGCAFLEDAFCAPYDVPNDGDAPLVIHSIDFRMTKPSGGFYSVAEIGLFSVDPASELPNLMISFLFPDGFTFRLFDPVPPAIVACGPVSTDCRADFFSRDTNVAAVSIVAVNDVASPGATAIPEPLSLLLFGTGVVATLARRRSRRALRA
jgi:hypothetical protein